MPRVSVIMAVFGMAGRAGVLERAVASIRRLHWSTKIGHLNCIF